MNIRNYYLIDCIINFVTYYQIHMQRTIVKMSDNVFMPCSWIMIFDAMIMNVYGDSSVHDSQLCHCVVLYDASCCTVFFYLTPAKCHYDRT